MDGDIRARVKACQTCALSKLAQNTKFGYLASGVASYPMEKLVIDFIGKLLRSKAGNCYALVVVDVFSKFSWVFPLREAIADLAVSSLKSSFIRVVRAVTWSPIMVANSLLSCSVISVWVLVFTISPLLRITRNLTILSVLIATCVPR